MFYGNIKSYDIHTYWNNNSTKQLEQATKLRDLVQAEFATEIKNGQLRVFKMWDKPIGPHPQCMFEIDFASPEIFSRIVPFYQLHHGSLSVLIHPRTGDEIKDHTQYALWLGHKLRLDTDKLQ